MKIRLSLALLLLSSAVAHAAQIDLGAPIKTTQVRDWRSKITKDIDCREVTDIPGTFLCLTRSSADMLEMMGRVSYFVEGKAAGNIVGATDPVYLQSPQAKYAGHDIIAKDFNAFFSKLDKSCSETKSLCATPLEQELRDKIIGAAVQKGMSNYVVITGSLEDQDGLGIILSHEILHARFFLNPAFQARVAKFWSEELDQGTREGIRQTLANSYNLDQPDGELLMLNEFQAYLLQSQPAYGELAMWSALAPRLKEYLGEELLPTIVPVPLD